MTPGVPDLVRAAVEHEAASDWEHARRVPSTYTWKIVDYLRSLAASERNALMDAFVANASYFFEPERDRCLHAYAAGHEEYRKLHEALPLIWGWQYQDVRYLRAVWADVRSKRPSPAFANTPVEVLARADAIRPTTASQIRKVVKAAFKDRYGSRPENLGSGEWRYPGMHRGRTFAVSIDYGGWDQLRYEVEYDDRTSGLAAKRLTYEGLVGAGLGHWDFLTADNLDESVTLLCELVEELVSLPERLVQAPGRPATG